MTPLTYQVGAVRVHLLSDGVFWSDGGAAFGVVPRVLWEKIIRPDALGRIAMELRSLLIESDDGLILVDTGHGQKLSAKRREQLGLTGQRRLLDELADLGYRADDVRMVINTHLHADHCGGNTILEAEGRLAPAFPNATYVVQRLELADATYPNERTRNAYFHENFLPLTNLCDANGAGLLRILSGDTQINPEVRVQVTPGHTRAHQVVIVESQGQSAVFLGDAAGYARQPGAAGLGAGLRRRAVGQHGNQARPARLGFPQGCVALLPARYLGGGGSLAPRRGRRSR